MSLTDDGRFGNGIGLAEMHPAVAAGGFDGDGIAAEPTAVVTKVSKVQSTAITVMRLCQSAMTCRIPLRLLQALFADVEGKEQTLRRRELKIVEHFDDK